MKMFNGRITGADFDSASLCATEWGYTHILRNGETDGHPNWDCFEESEDTIPADAVSVWSFAEDEKQ